MYALLAAERPRSLLTAYTLSGLAFTVLVGLLVVLAFHGVDVGAGTDSTKGGAYLVAGVAVLAVGWLVQTERISWRRGAEAPEASGRWSRLLEGRLTVRTALLAGPVTHLPGVFYLVALNLIVAESSKIVQGLVEILIYNLVWFALPICALVVCFVRPEAARDVVGAVNTWSKDHSRLLVVVVCVAVGCILAVRGIVALT